MLCSLLDLNMTFAFRGLSAYTLDVFQPRCQGGEGMNSVMGALEIML